MIVSPGGIEVLSLGPLATNAYLLTPGQSCWVVDPGLWPGELIDRIRELGRRVEGILLTHGHGDHIAGITPLVDAFGPIRVFCPAGDAEMLTRAEMNMSAMFGLPITVGPADELLSPGQCVQVGPTSWRVLDTSGHTPGGVSFHCDELATVITGDALFAGGVGRTDIPQADETQLLANIRKNLLTLADETQVLPGHGPATTIARERRNAPCFR